MHAIAKVHMVQLFGVLVKADSFIHSGWSSVQVCEVPGGGSLWGGGGGLGLADTGKGGYQENITFRTPDILPGR